MRTSEERIIELHRRMENMQWTRIRRTYMIRSTAALAACLAVTVMLAYVIGILPAQDLVVSTGRYTASIFASFTVLRYVVVAFLAFVLGVAVTIFCFRMRKHMEEEKHD